ncbi:hypothetical protein [Aeromonas veronii]|uniref:hypothetical protein n=1 Tax=Aeromonas veronii TaxID=654 RepID=UPI003D1C255B
MLNSHPKLKNLLFISLATFFSCGTQANGSLAIKTAEFTASVQATIPSTFKLVTQSDGASNTVALSFPSAAYDAITSNFDDQIVPVKFIGNVNDEDITLTAESLQLTNSQEKSITLPMSVAVSTSLGDDSTTELLMTTDQPSITLRSDEVNYNGFELGFGFVSLQDAAPGNYEGTISLTAQQNI